MIAAPVRTRARFGTGALFAALVFLLDAAARSL